MTPSAQELAIAVVCGFTEIYYAGQEYQYLGSFGPNENEEIPGYTIDLNACRGMMAFLPGDKQVQFVKELRLIIERTDDLRTVHWLAVIDATAAQRCEAFLRTLDLWDDKK